LQTKVLSGAFFSTTKKLVVVQRFKLQRSIILSFFDLQNSYRLGPKPHFFCFLNEAHSHSDTGRTVGVAPDCWATNAKKSIDFKKKYMIYKDLDSPGISVQAKLSAVGELHGATDKEL